MNLSTEELMKVAYLIIFMLLTLNANANGRMLSASEVPMDSIRKQLKLKKVEKNLPLEAPVEFKEHSLEENSTKGKEVKPGIGKSPRNIHTPEPKSLPEKNDSMPSVEEKAGAESKVHFELTDNNDIAMFPGGERAVRDFIRKNKRYPEECKATRAHGKVVIEMTVAPDGTVGNIAVAASSGNKYMDAEAMRVAGLMPKWNAAKDIQNGKDRLYRMSMTFRPGR